MAVFVDFEVEGHAVELSKFCCSLMADTMEKDAVTAVFERLKPLCEEKKHTELVTALLDNLPTVYAHKNPGDVESFLHALASFITRALKSKQLAGGTRNFCEKVGAQDTIPLVTLSGLTSMFNALPPNKLRGTTLTSAVAFATKHSLVDQLSSCFPSVEQWCKEWELNDKTARALYHEISQAIKALGTHSAEFYETLQAHLRLFENDGDESLQQACDVAYDACLHAIALPSLFDFADLCSMKAVKALGRSNSVKHSQASQLLKVVAFGNVQQLQAFLKANPNCLKTTGLDEGALLDKMRIVTLVAEAGKSPSLTFAAIADALKVDADDVELWVMRAVRARVLTARISQVEQVVYVSSLEARGGENVDWKKLQTQVGGWKNNLDALLGAMEEVKVRLEQRQAM